MENFQNNLTNKDDFSLHLKLKMMYIEVRKVPMFFFFFVATKLRL